jgi:single-strand DNA-binding protein
VAPGAVSREPRGSFHDREGVYTVFDTEVTLIGNVLSEPEWRRTTNTGTYVMTFRIASTARRFDKAGQRWIDGDSLRLKVVCWRKLGQNVMASISLGEPLVVHGRLYSRDWVDEAEVRHTSYELDAITVGHDMSKGVSKFARRRAVAADSVLDGDPSAGGEPSEPVEVPDSPAELDAARALLTDFDPATFVTAAAGGDDEDDDDEISAELEEVLAARV